jgi:hypothetical protein
MFGDTGDATVTGYRADGTTVSVVYNFSSKTETTLTLNWTGLTKVTINFADGTNGIYGAVDHIVLRA